MNAGISLIIPAYHEEDCIGAVLEALPDQLEGLTYEIIVVDDGSTDRTGEIAAQYDDVVVLHHRSNRGYGAALKTGIRRARYDLIGITDADGTYPNERIPDLVRHLYETESDMVVGSRTGENVNIPLVRRPAKWIIGKLANIVAGEPIPDINSGLRVFQRDIALSFFSLLPEGFSFTTTITLGMLANHYFVEYLPIDYHKRVGKSKIKPIRDTLNFTQLILRIALYFAPLKVFVPLSFFLLVFAVIWGLFSTTVLGRFADTSTLVVVMAGAQMGALGLVAELINKRTPNIYRKN
jgi:glycosyltransferase involved in cell wall biosynthesis